MKVSSAHMLVDGLRTDHRDILSRSLFLSLASVRLGSSVQSLFTLFQNLSSKLIMELTTSKYDVERAL